MRTFIVAARVELEGERILYFVQRLPYTDPWNPVTCCAAIVEELVGCTLAVGDEVRIAAGEEHEPGVVTCRTDGTHDTALTAWTWRYDHLEYIALSASASKVLRAVGSARLTLHRKAAAPCSPGKE